VHNIVLVLGLAAASLEEELYRSPENVDARDSRGRTALGWAAARGDENSVITLLRFGAEPNNVFGSHGTLSLAAT
jgi:ankyrin repeat protein